MNKKAFTLIELLVTILIIMILAGYTIFAYLDSLYEAENTRAKAKLEIISAGYERFMLEHPAAAAGTSTAFANSDNIDECKSSDGTSPKRLIGCGYVPKMDFNTDKMKYQFFLGNACVCTGLSGDYLGPAYMRPKTGADGLGKFGGNYCACINLKKGGRAEDGTYGS